ncbi:ATP-dependent DNA helicase [Trichonephila inaurata madagascariensis]|uniref:ATP-dependent DNA helicase n=1 Tax=Trichonephila inaurata madagascariensis TaxID=2747483 RepID=A0A8X6WXT2_9ARAC|nr:ATP-dependent DNA helicase [Trichonephila inaurata madagascariensis]
MFQQWKLLVWDESTISHKKDIEALNRTFQGLRESADIIGGMVVLSAGNFRQNLLVIQRGTPADEIRACIITSSVWAKTEIFCLKTIMRVHNNLDSGHMQRLLKINDECLNVDDEGYISFFREFRYLLENDVNLNAQVYPGLQQILNCDSTCAPNQYWLITMILSIKPTLKI